MTETASTHQVTSSLYGFEYFTVHAQVEWEREVGQAGARPCQVTSVQIEKVLDEQDNLRHDLEDWFENYYLKNGVNFFIEPLDREFDAP
tara:strand:- start:66 stop:332 length:267 start_codon:yes stop_codon:yes gene_type:complete